MKVTQPSSNLLGYNGYVFRPEDWKDPRCKNRLSTCIGKYRRPEYGKMTLEQLLHLFDTLCPYEVVWRVKRESFLVGMVSRSNATRNWMQDNIEGYWRDLNFSDKLANGEYLTINRSGVRFQNEMDAMLFKLTWDGDNNGY